MENEHSEKLSVQQKQDEESVNKFDQVETTEVEHLETPSPLLTDEEKAIDKRILRKIDLLILPFSALNYFFTSMARNDIGNAKIAGFMQDNHLTNTQFSTVVSLFYVGYIISNPIGGLLISNIETCFLLGIACMFWGIFTVMMIFSKSIVLPGILRVFIGAAEGLTQINTVYLNLWYTKDEIAVRTGIWYSSGVLASSFNGLIAWGIQENDHSSLKPWQLLFLIEGILPIAFGPIIMYFYPSSPANVKKYFTPEEKALCIARTQRARNSPGTRVQLSAALTIFKSPEIYFIWICYFCVIWPSTGYGTFLPSIIDGLGYSPAESQLLTVPVSVIGFVSVNFWCYYSDKFQLRGPLIMGLALVTLTGFSILLGVSTAKAPRVFALCLISFGLQPLIPLTLTFLFVNTVGVSRRALAIPLQIVCGQCGGLAVNYTFVNPPRYLNGTIATLCTLGLLIFVVSGLDIYFMVQNRKKAARVGTEEWHHNQTKSFDELGTNHPNFTFTL